MKYKYIIKRVFLSIVTLWLIATIIFFMLRLLPGTPFSSMQMVGLEMQDRLIEYYGLDKPLFEQYLIFLKNAICGDFGMSYKYLGQSVNDILKQALPISVQLGLQAYTISLIVGIVSGCFAAKKNGSKTDDFMLMLSALFSTLPVFVLSSVFQYLFGFKWKIFPLVGWGDIEHMVLPVASLVFGLMSTKFLTSKALSLEVLNQNYIKTAKANGLPKHKIFFKYEIKNILVPVLSTIGIDIAYAMMGSFVVEKIFNIRGIGYYFVLALQNNDYSLILGISMFFSVALVVLNLFVDIIICFIDPRIKFVE